MDSFRSKLKTLRIGGSIMAEELNKTVWDTLSKVDVSDHTEEDELNLSFLGMGMGCINGALS